MPRRLVVSFEAVFELGEGFDPVPVEQLACTIEGWESFLKEELNPIGPIIDRDFTFFMVDSSLELKLFGEFAFLVSFAFEHEERFLLVVGHGGVLAVLLRSLFFPQKVESCNYSALPHEGEREHAIVESKITIKND